MATLTETEKKQLGRMVGNDLANSYGKKKYYSQKEIRSSLDRNAYAVDVHCLAYCLFMDHDSFDAYHESIGETCDYLAMKSSMLSAVTEHASDSWLDFDFDLSWFDWPDIDISSVFDLIDW